MTLRDLLTEGEHALQSAGIEDWKMDAWYLMEEMLHVSRTRYLMEPSKEVSPEEEMLYIEQIAKRASHIPLQHLTGHQEFMGLDFRGVRRCAGTQAGYGNTGRRSTEICSFRNEAS
ncbi:MAG: hypothetical protein V8S38_01505 [Lachnospiraceae bacterium]